jgi:hypothetical protein
MMPNEVSAIDEHDERLIRMMEQAHASSLLHFEAIKLRIAHHEKLVILCASTLALSFTAATAFHGNPSQAEAALSSLLHAWQLLMSAIILGVISNWLSVSGAVHFGNLHYDKQIGVRFSILEESLRRIDPEYAKQEREAWNRNSTKFAQSGKYFNIFNRLAGGIGFCAQLAAFCAFVHLYYFAKTILTNF